MHKLLDQIIFPIDKTNVFYKHVLLDIPKSNTEKIYEAYLKIRKLSQKTNIKMLEKCEKQN